ncbi:MAG TPA: AAA family ATPase, partial [Geminicoccaceae bacterium]|nr:AAA family ATPase [Geminicoccaceae bacterium]
MLLSLSVRHIVLIEQLDLCFGAGLCVLTGETGAGKSILLDALGLALGGRAERALLRRGAERGSSAAVFAPPPGHPVWGLLAEHGIEAEADDGQLVLRRVLTADGRTRAFVNDQPVATALARRIGQALVEVHGQHDQRGLLDPATHRAILDAYGRLDDEAAAVRAAHVAWREAQARHAEAGATVERAREEEAYLRQVHRELEQLAPQVGEEEELAEARARLQNRERLAEAIREALQGLTAGGGVEERLGAARRRVERVEAAAGGLLADACAALDRALDGAAEAVSALERAGAELDLEENRLEAVEERLFALRAAARKHRTDVDSLPRVREETAAALAALEEGGEALAEAARRAEAARARFVGLARALSAGRAKAALALAEAVMAELPPLRLDKARFAVALEALAEDAWTADGAERVGFVVSTNPGEAPGPLARIASGGELSRFMLALKVVLARVGSAPSLV